MTTTPASCPTHIGFPAGRCARCLAGPVMAAPVPVSVRRMFAARTSAQDRAARAQHTQEAAQRAKAIREAPATQDAPAGRQEAAAMARGTTDRITFKGVSKTRAEWGEVFGLTANGIAYRVARGAPLDAVPVRGSNRHVGTWDYTADREVDLAAADAGARMAAEMHRDVKPARTRRLRHVTEQQIDALIVAPSVASEETVGRLLAAVGWSLRRESVLGQGVLLAAPGSAP